jgi:hypothetical protein
MKILEKIQKYQLKIKRVMCLALLLTIVFVAHTPAPLEPLGQILFQLLAPLGLDIPMTPVTSDMQLMIGRNDQNNRYVRKIEVDFENQEKEQTVSAGDLNFYRFRLPFQLMSEMIEIGGTYQAHALAICAELSRQYKLPVMWFRVRLVPKATNDEALGLDRKFVCHEEPGAFGAKQQ